MSVHSALCTAQAQEAELGTFKSVSLQQLYGIPDERPVAHGKKGLRTLFSEWVHARAAASSQDHRMELHNSSNSLPDNRRVGTCFRACAVRTSCEAAAALSDEAGSSCMHA